MTRSGRFPRALVLWAVLFSLSATGVGHVGAAQSASNDPMRIVPADALFCVRINRLSATLSQVDQFLTGVSPVGISMPVQAKLGALLGAPQPAGVNMAGDFAVFGPLPGGERPDLKRVGVLVPLSNLQQFLTNPNVAKPDAQGILKIGAAGKQDIAGLQIGGYLLLTGVAHQQALTEAKSWTSGASTGSLAQRLSPEELKRATNAPAWAYTNVQVAAKMYGPTIQQKLKEVTQTFQQMQAKGGPLVGPPETVIDLWVSLLNSFMQEAQFVSLSVDPSAAAIRLAPVVAGVPNSDMAKILSLSGPTQEQPDLGGYLENGAIMNGVARFSPALSRAIGLKRVDLLTALMGPTMSKEDLATLRKLAADSADAFGGSAAWSMLLEPTAKPPFKFRYVFILKDKQKFNDVLEQSSKMMREGMLADFGKKFGLKMQFDLKRNAGTYKDVPIDAITLGLQPTDANSPQGQMMKTMFAGGLNIRLAVVNDLLLYTLAGDPEKEIHALIDQAKAGSPGPAPSEVQAALQLLPDTRNAGFFGTFNEVRAIQMGAFMSMPMPMPVPQVEVQSQSNIAFAGDIGNGRLRTDIAIPKQQVLEVMQIIMRMQQQMQPQQKPATPPGAKAPGQT